MIPVKHNKENVIFYLLKVLFKRQNKKTTNETVFVAVFVVSVANKSRKQK